MKVVLQQACPYSIYSTTSTRACVEKQHSEKGSGGRAGTKSTAACSRLCPAPSSPFLVFFLSVHVVAPPFYFRGSSPKFLEKNAWGVTKKWERLL